MPQIPGLPEELIPTKGVEMRTPPTAFIQPATSLIESAMASLPRDSKGHLVWIAQKVGDEKSVNAAIVNRVGGHAEVVLWIGKSWGTPESAGLGVGTAGRIHW